MEHFPLDWRGEKNERKERKRKERKKGGGGSYVFWRHKNQTMKHTVETFRVTMKKVYVHLLRNVLRQTKAYEWPFHRSQIPFSSWTLLLSNRNR